MKNNKLHKLVVRKNVKFINKYEADTILKCSQSLIVGNIIGDDLIETEITAGFTVNPTHSKECQWDYLGKLYNVPRPISLTLFGDLELNWQIECKGHNPALDTLLSYWLSEGFVRMEYNVDDFFRQQHNINTFISFKKQRQKDLSYVTDEYLKFSREITRGACLGKVLK